MTTTAAEYRLCELMICAAAETFRGNGEVLATGIGVIPRLAASLAMKSCNTDLMMTDSEAWMLSAPNAVSGRHFGEGQKQESWMGFSRIFDNVWGGKRHALVGPSQIDRFGQTNISALGGTYEQPKVQMLGVRGFPGNSISHANSFYVPAHSKRVFVEGECDVVCSIGYNAERLPRGYSFDDIDIRQVVTDLCVMDWQGPNHQLRLLTLHPGITVQQVIDNTGFAVHIGDEVTTTVGPTIDQIAIIASLDPVGIRHKQLADNPVGDRR
jgi:glutaconate CoA-transferase subunit B